MQVNDSSSVTASTTAASDRAQLSREQFLQILVAELSQQDPMNPLENAEFLGQLTQIQNLEAVAALTDGIQALQHWQQIGSAGTLIGKIVRAQNDAGVAVNGIVDRVEIRGDKVRLIVDGHSVSLGAVTEIQSSEASE